MLKGLDSGFNQDLRQVSLAIASGQDFASAIAQLSHKTARYGFYFDAWTVSLLRMAEYSGALVEMCQKLASAAESGQQHSRLYRSVEIAAITFLVSGVVLVAALSAKTANSLLQPKLWMLVLLLVGIGILITQLLHSPRWRQWIYPFLFKLPGVRRLVQAQSLLYFAELELPLSCGVPILTAVELVRDRIPDPEMAKNLAIAAEKIRSGETLSQSLQGRLPPLALQMIRTGEETGNLEPMLQKLAEYYATELEGKLRQLQGILRPLNILALGFVVALLGIQLLFVLLNVLSGYG